MWKVRITRGLERSKEGTRLMQGHEWRRQKTCCKGNAPKGYGLDFKAEYVPRKAVDSDKY
jgi:hypothetical protein